MCFFGPLISVKHFSPGVSICGALPLYTGVGGRGLATNKPPKRDKKGSPEMCPPSLRGA